jgi:hypothetical protein
MSTLILLIASSFGGGKQHALRYTPGQTFSSSMPFIIVSVCYLNNNTQVRGLIRFIFLFIVRLELSTLLSEIIWLCWDL